MNRSGRGVFIPDSEDLPPDETPLDLNLAELEIVDGKSGTGIENEENGFLVILDFATEHNIPSVDLGRLGVSGDPRLHDRIAYTLGTGHTSIVIRHVTEEDTADVVPKGSIIALKKFLSNTKPKGNNRSSLDTTYKTVKKEIDIYCHPVLSEHPNICKLLFLGWEQDLPLPILGLELGAYGSLEHILTAPGLGPSFLQKAHLTIDIALGISAFHHAGIIHGDLKPENVLVLEHPQRQLVGKLSDFGGVLNTNIQVDPAAAPEHVTELWCAPEVLFRDANIDWEAADVYSYGLIAASIWARPSGHLTKALGNSSFLWPCLPSVFTEMERRDLLLVLKSDADDDAANVLARALARLGGVVLPLLEPVLRATLSSDARGRKSLVELVSVEVAGIAGAIGRELFSDMPSIDNSQRRFVPSGNRLFKVWSPSFRERSVEFQNFVLRKMIAEVGDADKILNISFEDLPDASSSDITVDQYLSLIIDKARSLFRASTNDNLGNFPAARHRARLASHISMCYLFPVGTSYHLKTGLTWLFVAAFGGYQFAILFAPLMRRCYEGQLAFEPPTKLFLSISALAGSRRALDVLREEYYSQYEVILRIIQERSSSCGELDDTESSPYFLDILLSYQKTETLESDSIGLLMALKSHNFPRAIAMLEEGEDASIVNDKGAGVMHHLSLLADESGADLVQRCFQNGARLDIESMDEKVMHMRVASGTPLKWAALKGRMKLFSALLELHKLHDIPILDYDAVLATLTMGHHAKTMKILFEFKIGKPALCPSQLQPDGLTPKNLLLVVMDSRDMDSLERRLHHGSSSQIAYEETVSLLLDQGADPTEGFSTDCPFYRALQQDDDTPLRMFVKQIAKYQPDPLSYLVDPGKYSQIPEANMHTALQTCIYSKSFRCFNILLENFPELMEVTNARGLTALHSASYFEDNLPMLRVLLEKGAKILVWSKDRSTPLSRALRNHNLEAANLMCEKCTPEEMEILLGHDETTGFSTMSKLMSPWISGRSPAMLESFQWRSSLHRREETGRKSHRKPNLEPSSLPRQPPNIKPSSTRHKTARNAPGHVSRQVRIHPVRRPRPSAPRRLVLQAGSSPHAHRAGRGHEPRIRTLAHPPHRRRSRVQDGQNGTQPRYAPHESRCAPGRRETRGSCGDRAFPAGHEGHYPGTG